jgi:hypothetical protein
MKKIFFILTLLLAFSITANAQEQRTAPLSTVDAAKKDAVELGTLVHLDNAMVEIFFRLFETKYMILEDKNLSVERKVELERVMDAKIRATLTQNQMSILEANNTFFEKLKR